MTHVTKIRQIKLLDLCSFLRLFSRNMQEISNRDSEAQLKETALVILRASPLVVALLCKSGFGLHNQHAERKACMLVSLRKGGTIRCATERCHSRWPSVQK